MSADELLLRVDHLEKSYAVRRGIGVRKSQASLRAVDDVSFSLHRGETLGIVGESGCGKSTLARCLVRLIEPTSGRIELSGADITKLGRRGLRGVWRDMQMVFQDPEASLNPRKRVGQIVSMGLRLRGVPRADVKARVRELMEQVGLDPEYATRYPHEFSGGQRQRIGIARALAVEPRLIVLDEPVSALDVSVQAQVVNLLDDLQNEQELSYIFVAHDLSVVRHVSDRIAVMYLGKIVELSPAEELYDRPIHPYTQALLSAIPIPDRTATRDRATAAVAGEVSATEDLTGGCRFRSRCPAATELCGSVEPPLMEYAGGHLAACHHPLNVSADDKARATVSGDTPLGTGASDVAMPTRG